MRSMLAKTNHILLFLFILLLPIQLGTFFFLDFSYVFGVRIDYLAPALYLTDIFVLLLIIGNYNHALIISTLLKHKVVLTFLFFFILLNIFVAQAPLLAIYKTLKYIEVICVYFILKSSRFDFKNILVAFLCGTVPQVLLAVLQVWHGASMQGIFYFLGERYMTLGTPDIAKVAINGVEVLRAYGSFSHPNSLAGFYLLLYTFILTQAQFSQYKNLKYILLLCCSILIALSFSKITIVVYFIINCLYLIQYRRKHIIVFITILLSCVISVSLFLFTHGDPLSVEKRWNLTLNALTIIMDTLVTGVGIGNYLIAQSQFPIRYSYHFLQPVHNIFLLFIAESGIIISCFAAFFVSKIRYNTESKSWMYCMAVIILTGSLDHYWITLQQNLLLAPTIFALLSRQNERKV